MHEILTERVAELAQLAAMIRSGLDEAEATIPRINEHLSELATLGITSHQAEGPSIYAHPAGRSNDTNSRSASSRPCCRCSVASRTPRNITSSRPIRSTGIPIDTVDSYCTRSPHRFCE
jgi:hypothetical protein